MLTEIIFIVIGAMAVVVGYVLPAEKNGDGLNPEQTRKDVKDLVRHSLEAAKTDIHTEIDDTLEESMLSAERGMERITNDKIAAISDYADSVLNDIHKNHEEVMFMYDMLNDKQKNLSGLANEMTKTAAEARQTVTEARITAENAKKTSEETMMNAVNAVNTVNNSAQSFERVSQQSASSGIMKVQERNKEQALAHVRAMEAAGFAPLEDAIVRIEPEMANEKVIRSETKSEAEEMTAKAADMVAQALSAKVVSLSDKKQQHEMEVERLLSMQTQQVVNGDRVDAIPVMQNKQQTILHMHNEGMSNVTIARELNMGVGEVRLVLDLMGKHRKLRR